MAEMSIPLKAIFKIKRGTYEELKNIIPQPGEPVFETDNNRLKVGNEEGTSYADLPYINNTEALENSLASLTIIVEETKATVKDFLADADVTENAVDTLKEIQASLDAGEVSAANLLNKVNSLEAAHESYVEEHQAIRALMAQEDENLKEYFDTQLGVIANGLY